MGAVDDINLSKRILRHRLRDALVGMGERDRRLASQAACDRIGQLPDFKSADAVMLYLPLPGEADCTPLIELSLREQKAVCVPVVNWATRQMQPARIESLDGSEFIADRHGVRIPQRLVPMSIEQLSTVIVPALGFDVHGRRLGRGGGFYDRFLPRLRRATAVIGIAFERQIVQEIPTHGHDARVGRIATESRLIICA